MANKRKMKFRLGLRFLGAVSIYSIIFWGLCFLFDQVFNGVMLQLIYDLTFNISTNFQSDWVTPTFYFLYNNLTTILMIVYSVGIILIGMLSMRKPTQYLREVSRSIDVLLDENTPIGPLPPAIREMELSLRDIRYTVLRNQQLAHEAEQRKNDLVVYLAHDLKTPLASVIGYLTLLEESPDLPVTSRARYTAITLDKAYRLEQLINELFDITRYSMQTVVLERNLVNLTRMLHQMVDEFYPIFSEKGLHAETRIESELSIIADSDKLARVFDNLLRNAVAYSYAETTVRISAQAEGDGVVVKVRNTGDEIPAEKLANIFDKFFRADPSRSSRSGGAGLGLAIAKQIVEQHGGQISAESTTEYTEFTVVLPKISQRDASLPEPDKPDPEIPEEHRRTTHLFVRKS